MAQIRGPKGGGPSDLPFLVIASLIFVLLAPFASAGGCFKGDGSAGPEGFSPCKWTEDNDDKPTCCLSGDECLRGGLCMKDKQFAYQGFCARKDWVGCFDLCDTDGLRLLLICDKDKAEQKPGYNALYCTDWDKKKQCNADEGGVHYYAEDDVAAIGFPEDSREESTSSTSTPAKSTSKAPTSSRTTTAEPSETEQPGEDPSTSPAPHETTGAPDPGAIPIPPIWQPTVNSSIVPTDAAPNHDPQGTIPLAVGVSVGGVAVLSAIGIGVWVYRTRQRMAPARADSPPPTTGPGPTWAPFSNREEAVGRMRGF